MNLNAIANAAVQVVTPNVTGVVKRSTGSATTPDYKRVPVYDTFDPVIFQVQALSGDDLKQIDAANIQGVMRAVYANMALEGVNRLANKGGDLLEFAGQTWLVTQVLEPWDGPGWCKVAVALQVAPASGLAVTFVGDNTQPVTFDGTDGDPITMVGTPDGT